MKGKKKLTPTGAVWSAFFATPFLVIGLIMLIGVTAGSAGPTTTATPSKPTQVGGGPQSRPTALGTGAQTLAQLNAYWTADRMANARPYAIPTSSAPSGMEAGAVASIPQDVGETRVAIQRADGSVETAVIPAETQLAQPLTEPFHSQVPFDRFEWFPRYLRNVGAGSPNVAISTLHKMFYTQDADGDGGNPPQDFVCSSSTVGNDGVWTAGHCVNSGLPDATDGVNDGYSFNILHCPSYDISQGGENPTAGCWGASEIWDWEPTWSNEGNLEYDFGGTDTTDTPVSGPQTGTIGSFTGALGIAYQVTDTFGPSNRHWMALGYPHSAPFNGGKIHICSSQLGYVDDSDAAEPGTSVAIGCDMTGGSSGGPWIYTFGKPGQLGGGAFAGCCNFINGHNDWRHLGGGSPAEMASPFFNCRAGEMWWAINDFTPSACP